MKMTQEKLNEIVRFHGLWLMGDPKGSRADLRSANLSGANLSGANLSGANLSRADLSRADLSDADLSGADLRSADLSGANLSGANLSGADLSRADLSRADLSGANLSGANLSGANLSGANLSRANTDKKYIQVAGIGSHNRMTTYCVDDDYIWCGCLKGPMSEFIAAIQGTHAKNPRFLAEYMAAVTFFKACAKAWKKEKGNA